MTDTVHLAPHDPMPDGPGRQIVVLRRFDEDDPAVTSIQIILTGKPEQSTYPRRPDGRPMTLDEAVAVAGQVAAEEGIGTIYVLDRLEGGREQDILQHGGDHSVHMGGLVDTDEEDGERGPDMRDVLRRTG